MSYILDALRRADSERERGSVPGIRTQPVPPVSAAGETPPHAPKFAAWAIGGLSLALVGTLLWQFMRVGDPVREVVASQTAPAVPVAPPAPPALAPPPAPAAPPVVTAPPNETPRKAAPARTPTPSPRSPTKPAPVEARADSPVQSLQDLPPEVRSALPALSIGGSIYSEQPANRFLIINGQTFRENDKIAPDLVLEQIGQKAAVLRHKSYRYRLSY